MNWNKDLKIREKFLYLTIIVIVVTLVFDNDLLTKILTGLWLFTLFIIIPMILIMQRNFAIESRGEEK